jgi:Cu/Ag efflux pump CusA
MSWTVIFGLTFATFLTLVVVPVMYLLLMKVKQRFRRQASVQPAVLYRNAAPPTITGA